MRQNSIQGFSHHVNKGNKTMNTLSHSVFEIISSSVQKQNKNLRFIYYFKKIYGLSAPLQPVISHCSNNTLPF